MQRRVHSFDKPPNIKDLKKHHSRWEAAYKISSMFTEHCSVKEKCMKEIFSTL